MVVNTGVYMCVWRGGQALCGGVGAAEAELRRTFEEAEKHAEQEEGNRD